MSAKKRVLGRGLDSLLTPSSPEPVSAPGHHRVVEIDLDDLHPNLHQPRAHFDDSHIAELADSIRAKGILQPLLVRRHMGRYEIIAGERRYRAAKSLGLEKVPCLVTDATDQESFEIALVENLQRENLNAMEEARAFKSLIEQFGLSQEQAAARVGKNRSTVANSLRLLNLPLDIQEDILEGRLTSGHARAILQLPDAPKQRSLRNVIISRGLSVREAESAARRMLKPRKPRPPRPATFEAQMRSLQEAFSMKIGVPVFIKALTEHSGKVEIQYHNLDEFEAISEFFGVENT
ncbi:ParB/RepB/Spo0J family partition protein [Candidatus Sumerlaeota bacterium]|nr:ParB/RepB/Spo0J family partition protein [Candidatus Sumerlaeota bacterium]